MQQQMASFLEATNASVLSYSRSWGTDNIMGIMVTIFVAIITGLLVMFFGWWKVKSKAASSPLEPPRKYRFRKRDKVLFFGRKMLRQVKNVTNNTASGMRRRPSRVMMSKLRRFLAQHKESKPRVKQQSPPQSFLEADWSDFDEDHRLPPEVLYMLRSVRVFGHLEKPFFLELCRFMESITLKAGDYLFKIGDPDDSIYVVQHGLLHVFIKDHDGTDHLVKQVESGSNVHSLLSILDVLTGHPGPFKSVSAKAIQDSTILRLPAHAFKSMFEKFNESAVKVVQIIMIRLQRVTFSALHNYLGLSSELLKQGGLGDTKDMNIHQLTRTGTPIKRAAILAHSGSGEDSTDKASPHLKPMGSHLHARHSVCGGSAIPSRQFSEGGTEISDFDQALMRARASIVSDKSIVLSGSPPRRWSVTEELPVMPKISPRGGPDEELILDLSCKDLVDILGLQDPSLLKGRVSLKYIKAGTVLCKQGDQDSSLFFLVKGNVSVLQTVVGTSDKECLMFHSEPGEIIDVLAVLTGEPSFFTIRAKSDIIVVVITKPAFYEIMRVEPFIVLNIAHCTVRRMSSFVRQIDFALDWQILEAGKALFRQKDVSDSIFIVLTGRLRSVITNMAGKKELLSEYGRGELVGIVEVLTQHERATTVLAVRDTELTKIPAELLNMIKVRYPQVVTRLIHLLGNTILGSLKQKNTVGLSNSLFMSGEPYQKGERGNLATIAIVAVSEDVPITNFSLELQHALQSIGPTCRLTSDIVKARLGSSALDNVNEFRLFNWLSQQEDMHRMILYQCEYELSKWTKHCLRQADCILVVALADRQPALSPIEKDLENIAVKAQKELILLHKEDAETPRNTADWLNLRGWLSSHHHLRCPKRVLRIKSKMATLDMYENLFRSDPDRKSDFSRLARFLTGTSIGLVLGGGGARGLAHVGMIRSMEEAGIPIDMVAGTSMGSFIGALWAEEKGNLVRFTQRAREWSISMTSIWKKIWDLTYPAASMFTGYAFNESIENVFRDRQIEDLWIPYFCVTTNISNSSMRIHSVGSLWRYVRASMSLSGYFPPLCDPVDGHLLLDGGYVNNLPGSLWRYVRASMSYAPYLPPLCDPSDGHLLLDGAFVNNLPADVMHELGARHVFAVDVGSQDDTDLLNYGDYLSGWWLLWKRWWPWASSAKVPDMNEIQSRLAYVSCVRQMEVVKNSDYCEYIRPPINRYGTLQFGSFDEISEVGYHHGKTMFKAWVKGDLLEKLFQEMSSMTMESKTTENKNKNLHQTHVPVMAYFTDLAEQVSKIPQATVSDDFDLPESGDDLDFLEEILEEGTADERHPSTDGMDGYEEDDEFGATEDDDEDDDDEEDEDDNEDDNNEGKEASS